jgi:NAD(P)-dependent dehydrogenase (short-subunit alcohol dehydrogenase family)
MRKTALITGATSGIGQAIAKYYFSKNYKILSISRKASQNPIEWMENWVYYNCDLSNQFNLADLIQNFNERAKHDGPIDVLVNNAGTLFLEEDTLNANHLYNLLLYTPYVLTRQLSQSLVGGHVINIASVSGIDSDEDLPMYSALKAGVISLTKSFAKSLSPDVRVNCISPGFFKTNLVPGATPTHMFKNLPVPREGNPNEIIPVVKMLDESPYMTGANIVIDGGLTA